MKANLEIPPISLTEADLEVHVKNCRESRAAIVNLAGELSLDVKKGGRTDLNDNFSLIPPAANTKMGPPSGKATIKVSALNS